MEHYLAKFWVNNAAGDSRVLKSRQDGPQGSMQLGVLAA